MGHPQEIAGGDVVKFVKDIRVIDRNDFMREGPVSQEKGVPIFWDALRGRIVVSGSCG
jgi:hypothetical protein